MLAVRHVQDMLLCCMQAGWVGVVRAGEGKLAMCNQLWAGVWVGPCGVASQRGAQESLGLAPGACAGTIDITTQHVPSSTYASSAFLPAQLQPCLQPCGMYTHATWPTEVSLN